MMIELFPTAIKAVTHKEEEIVSEVDQTLLQIMGTDDINVRSYLSPGARDDIKVGTHNNINKLDNLIYKYRKYLPTFSAFIDAHIKDYLMRLGKPPEHSIINSWINLTPPGKRQVTHTHTNSLISGVYYHQTIKEHGGIIFYNPNPFSKMAMAGAEDQGQCFEPIPSTLILFPSWLEHSTEENISDTIRVSIAFNVIGV